MPTTALPLKFDSSNNSNRAGRETIEENKSEDAEQDQMVFKDVFSD